MTRCYDCLEHCLVGQNAGIYLMDFPQAKIPMPFHHDCAKRMGLKEVKDPNKNINGYWSIGGFSNGK